MGSPDVLTEQEAFEIVALLVSAAETSLVEPRKYPPFRLLHAAGLLAEHVARRLPDDEFWSALAADVGVNQDLMMWDTDRFEEFVRRLSPWILEHRDLERP